MGNAGERYATLDGLRGVAALLVAYHHLRSFTGGATFPGYLMVDLFFCLSGFVIARTYAPRLDAGLAADAFLAARIRRFYPLYAAGLAIGAMQIALALVQPALAAGRPIDLPALAFNAAMLPSPVSEGLYGQNGAAWSLLLELAVNFLFVAWLWRRRTRELALSAALAWLWLVMLTRDGRSLDMGFAWANLSGGMARAMLGFTIGVILHRVLGPSQGKAHPLALALPIAAVVPVLLMPRGADGVDWALLWLVFGVPLTVVLGALREPPAWARAAFGRIGALSFALYATHWPLALLLQPLLLALSPLAAAIVFLSLALAVALAAEALVDAPAQAWLRARRQRLGQRALHHHAGAAGSRS